jgi:hypothetical protein
VQPAPGFDEIEQLGDEAVQQRRIEQQQQLSVSRRSPSSSLVDASSTSAGVGVPRPAANQRLLSQQPLRGGQGIFASVLNSGVTSSIVSRSITPVSSGPTPRDVSTVVSPLKNEQQQQQQPGPRQSASAAGGVLPIRPRGPSSRFAASGAAAISWSDLAATGDERAVNRQKQANENRKRFGSAPNSDEDQA